MRLRPLIVAASLAAAGITAAVLTAPAAHAAPSADEPGPPTGVRGQACVTATQAWTERAVAKRLVTLHRLDRRLDAVAAVTDAHRSTLGEVYRDDRRGLKAVRAEVRRDDTCSEARRDARRVVTDFRVYLLVVPQTALTIRGDTGADRAAGYSALLPGYAAAVDAMPDGADKEAAGVVLDALDEAAAAASSSYAPIGAAVLGLVPADYPASEQVLDDARADARSGRAALAEAATAVATLDGLVS